MSLAQVPCSSSLKSTRCSRYGSMATQAERDHRVLRKRETSWRKQEEHIGSAYYVSDTTLGNAYPVSFVFHENPERHV